MAKECSICRSTELRLSRIRWGDWLRLFFLMYPVRCLDCYRRGYVFLPMIFQYKRSIVAKREAKPEKA